MDFQLSEDQSALVAALETILQDHAEIPQSERGAFYRYDARLQSQLEGNGFLDAARDMGDVEAALVVYETARLASVVDVLGRGFVAPLLIGEAEWIGPVALCSAGGLERAIRNLPIARKLLVEDGLDVCLIDLTEAEVIPVESILGYPYGRFAKVPDLGGSRRIVGAGARMRRLWRVGLAAEAAGAARGAIDFTLDYVKQRRVFGRSVGSFQSVQHRLVARHGYAKAAYYLAMRAAWSENETDAAIAACHVQSGIGELLFDLHQFNGGMGMTNEHLLHYWLYRVRALQADVGGPTAAALEIAARRWDAGAPQQAAAVREVAS